MAISIIQSYLYLGLVKPPCNVHKILIIDDEDKLRSLLARIIRAEGFEVQEAADAKSGLQFLERQTFAVILCDVKLPDANGVELVKKLKETAPATEVILLTAYGNIPDGVQAIQHGAFDYITKGNDNDRILPLIHRAIEKNQLRQRVENLEKRVGEKYSFDTLLGQSTALRRVVELAQKVAVTDATVLLTGETGTGKEVFAQAIHQASGRASHSFVALNSSTFSRDLLESELFGHVKGAFTGALNDKKGFIEEADGGTLFLDEIGEMPLDLQAKLLRVLETSEFIRVGEHKPRRSDFRLIAATNRDLKTESEQQRFRPDLYFRLNVFALHLPPLSERVADIEPMVRHFIAELCAKLKKVPLTYEADFLAALKAYPWPGNIRELRNCLERSVILAGTEPLSAALLPFEFSVPSATSLGLTAFSLNSAEKLQIQKALNHTKGNKAEAARLLEIGIATLYRKIEEYSL
jgi:two-component system, NtrC family, response regulator